MGAAETVIMLALTLGLAFAGWNCVVKNDYLVKIHRQQLEQANARFFPFARFIRKPWYPIFLRMCGIATWLCAIVLIYLTWFREPAR